MLLQDRELTQQAAQIDALLEEIESFPDPALRARMSTIVQGLVGLYGEGLARLLAIIEKQASKADADRLLASFAGDDLVAHLLLLHDLHPVPLETRVARALDEVRPYLQSHGGNVALLGVEEGIARLRLQGSCSGCPSSTITLKLAIEEAIQKAAPDLLGIEAEGAVEPPLRSSSFVPATTLRRKDHPSPAGPAWTMVGGLPQIAGGGMAALQVAGLPVLFCKLDSVFYAYRNACPGCGQSLELSILQEGVLACPACEHTYDVRRAGRCLDASDLTLEPIPLLVQDDLIKVALAV